MSEGVRVGQIGCGRHGRLKLARALASVGDACLMSCADLDEGTALRTTREFGFARHYQDYGEMLAEEELDGVVVALPHHMLAEAAVAAANAGCNVFVEKPVGVNKAQAVGLREAADRAGVNVMVGYAFRFDPARRHPQVPYRARRPRRDNPGVRRIFDPPFYRQCGWVVCRSDKRRADRSSI